MGEEKDKGFFIIFVVGLIALCLAVIFVSGVFVVARNSAFELLEAVLK